MEPLTQANLDADDPLDDDDDDLSDDSEEDNAANLTAELNKIKKERAEEIFRKVSL